MTLLLLACSTPLATPESRDTAPTDDTASQTNPDDTGAETISWSELFTLLDHRCSGCHESDYPSGAGFMVPGDGATTYTNLVGGDVSDAAFDAGWFAYVVGGHPEMSLLSDKFRDDPHLGDPMPPPGSPADQEFDAAEKAAVDAWIAAGATADG